VTVQAPLSFRDELVKYRRQLVAHDPDPLALAIIDRWRDHAGVEKIWQTLQRHIPADKTLPPEIFISLVLQQRINVAEKLQQIVDHLPKLEKQVNERAKQHRRAKDYAAIALEAGLLANTRDRRRQALSRKSAPRMKFIRDWSAKVQEICGTPLDEVVAVVTSVAFDEVVDTEAVRDARRFPTGVFDPQNRT
jgi:hypothetical protein